MDVSGRLVREDHPFVGPDQWEWVLKMEAINGRESVLTMLGQGPLTLGARIAGFRRYEDATSFESVRNEVARLAPVPVAQTAPPVTYISSPPSPHGGPKPVRVTISSYSGNESENLIFWLREVDLGLTAGLVRDERQRITYAISHLKGRAKDWALTSETTTPGCFIVKHWPVARGERALSKHM